MTWVMSSSDLCFTRIVTDSMNQTHYFLAKPNTNLSQSHILVVHVRFFASVISINAGRDVIHTVRVDNQESINI